MSLGEWNWTMFLYDFIFKANDNHEAMLSRGHTERGVVEAWEEGGDGFDSGCHTTRLYDPAQSTFL